MNILRRLRIPTLAKRVLALVTCLATAPSTATTALADQPVFTNTAVPGNLALAISVEFPTVINAAYQGSFSAGTQYLGYFDARKCYRYRQGQATHDAGPNGGNDVSHFFPVGSATSDFKCTTAGLTDAWSGSFLNWLTMQSIDSFRWALTGGYRRVDTTTATILERAWSSNQGDEANFRIVGDAGRASPSARAIEDHTPLAWTSIRVSVRTRGNQILFTRTGTLTSSNPATAAAVHHSPGGMVADGTVYRMYVRVKVCDSAASAGPLEGNCTAYPGGTYKPTGLIHQYADRFRYSAFGYLNDGSLTRDGGVLRAQQKFVGPLNHTPGSTSTNNLAREWDPDTGIFITNPNPADASATNTLFGLSGADAIVQSGVMNYLNRFGQTFQGSHKTFDPVGELYYAAVRYFKALGNVSSWTDPGTVDTATRRTRADGFPVITGWTDPIQHACQRNFILGIGDVNSHADKNVPGIGISTASEPPRPAALALDPMDAKAATDKVGALHGLGASLGSSLNVGGCCSNNSALMAGIAYDANTQDIRPDDPAKPQTLGRQTIQTYWLDVLEFGAYKSNNPFYLAAKYGGFRVPKVFDAYGRTTDIPEDLWTTTSDLTPGGQKRPDNYYTAAQPDQMIAGLTRAFEDIAAALKAYTTSFATSLPQTALAGNISYGAQYDSSNWSGEVQASTVSFDANTGDPNLTLEWTFSSRLAAQIAEDGGTGWSTRRHIVTWVLTTPATGGAGTVGSAVPFRHASLSAAQKTALDTIYRTGDDSADFLNYLRGDRTHEENATAAGSARIYRTRSSAVGDIVGSRVRPVGPPAAPFAAATNPGYAAFRTTWASRPTVVYVGTNAGLLHAINGAVSGGNAGREMFAYVPDMLFQGPSSTPAVNGLASRGDPDFSHRALVDGSPVAFDLDFSRTQNNTRTGLVGGSNDWRTVLVGGMGKGGRGYYAIDVTDPAGMTSEALVASKVLWEISAAHPDFAELGYTYGEPAAVKTRKWGWVLIFASGYNTSDGQGRFFIVNPRNGALLEKISTGVGTPAAQAGLAHLQSYIVDRTDGTADAVYAGDLLGNLWRWDLRAATGPYPAPEKIAALTNNAGQALPVTSRPMVLVHPATNRRYVTVGTGRLLDNSDISASAAQAFVAVIDGTANTFATTAPGGAAFPITRSQLVRHTDLTAPVVVDTTSQAGWWVDLGVSAAGNGWRVITEPSAFYGVVTFVAMLPNTSPCNPSGISRVYSVDVGSGRSRLISPSGTAIAFSELLPGVVIEHRTYSVDGQPRLVACNDLGTCQGLRRLPAGLGGLRRLNWRELPLAD